jgi:putative nucleotidyltransferase with HDIG domain
MPVKVKVFILSMILLGMVLFFIYLPDVTLSTLPYIIILGLFAGILEKYHVELPNAVELSGSSIFTMVVLMLYGIPEAIVIDIIVSIFLMIIYKLPPPVWLINVCQFAVSVVIAGSIMQVVQQLLLHLQINAIAIDIIAFLLTTTVYIFVSYSLTAIDIVLFAQQKFKEVWFDRITDTLFGLAITALLGIRLTVIFETENHVQFWIEAIFIIGIFIALRYSFQMFINLRKTYLGSMESITNLVEDKLQNLSGHAARVGKLARKMAEEMKLSQEEIDNIHYAALMHDIGKLQVSEAIFQKRGPRTVEEEAEYKKHPELGSKMVEEVFGLSKAVEYILSHHEQWDGKGYPNAISGSSIPLGARIIAAANRYDHIIHNKKLKDTRQAFMKLANKELDPELVELIAKNETFKIEEVSDKVKDQVLEGLMLNKVKNSLTNSKLLKEFVAGEIVQFKDDVFYNLEGEHTHVPCEEKLAGMLKQVDFKSQAKHEFLHDTENGRVYNIYWFLLDRKVYVMFFDVSHMLEYEKAQEMNIRRMYRDVIYSVTQGKLMLLERNELGELYQNELLHKVPIQSNSDVAICRKAVDDLLTEYEITGKEKFHILLSTSEVATNVLKHAVEGVMKVYKYDNKLRIIVEDMGSGINLSDLPKSTLLSGFSSKRSLGQGFSLLLQMMDKVALYTSSRGTTVVLEIVLKEGTEEQLKHNDEDLYSYA